MRRSRLILLLLLLCSTALHAAVRTEFGDSTKTHVFTLGANLWTRGEYMQGALPNADADFAAFIRERTRLTVNYKQPFLEVQITAQHAGVWGSAGGGSFSLSDAWAKVDYKGAFMQLGRQPLTYDDERVIGLDDWSMTGAWHDALKLGYEGFGHKIHLWGAYNQNFENTDGGTRYLNGSQVYKNMEGLWYHYDFPRWFSGSLLFLNTGLQSAMLDSVGQREDKTYYQQMLGTYWRFHYDANANANAHWWIDIDASFYYQLGKTEGNVPINAWMAAVDFRAKANDWIQFNTGYFHLSGDENYTVPPVGGMGLQRYTQDHSFNLLHGSKHQFYGAMDFFYLKSFYGGYSPGLQDWHIGTTFTYKDQLSVKAQYHNLATSVQVKNAPTLMLGHELELIANYQPLKWMTVQAGYTFMQGTKTMEMVKRASDRNQSHWVYLMLVFNPTFVTVRF